jgi:glycosyltransferase involved in cell wall biosynthesis
MILVDDESKDRSVEIIESYKDPRIKLIRQKNRGIAGLAQTYNAAVAASSGSLIAILEGDDLWPRYKLEIQVEDFDDEAVVLSSGLTSIVDEIATFIAVTPARPVPPDSAANRPVGAALKTMLHPDHSRRCAQACGRISSAGGDVGGRLADVRPGRSGR